MRQSFLPYCKPAIEADDIKAVVDSMEHGWLTTGPKVREFERGFADASGVRHAVALSSCTAGLHVGLLSLGVGPGDEVIMPSLSFVAGANCARQIGAKPVFCDVDERTLCVTPATIDAVVTPNTKAIMPMHFGGHPVGIERIVAYAKSKEIAVLEDAAHAVGTLDNGKWAGAVSDAAVYSFYATKNITSAEGGMLVTNDDSIADQVRLLSLHGMDRDAWKRYTQGGTWTYDVPVLGYKYNMPDLLAAMGISQLAKLDKLQAKRDELASLFTRELASIEGIVPVSTPLRAPDRHSWCVFAILNDESKTKISRDQLIVELREANIGTSVHFIPTHRFSSYKDQSLPTLTVTDRIWGQLVSLPLYPSMSSEDAFDVIEALRTIVARAQGQTLEAKTAG